RRSDQDRSIIKDPGGNDDRDTVIRNPDVTLVNADGHLDANGNPVKPDNKFFPEIPVPNGVKVPDTIDPLANKPSFGGLSNSSPDVLRKAAFTTLMANRLFDASTRTGQTRFVLDGKIVDITGFRR